MGKRGGHGATWLVANGDNGTQYCCYCRKYSDAFEREFKKRVFVRAGGCRTVHRSDTQPDGAVVV